MQFHDKLLQLRKKDQLTQAELAEQLGVSRQAISKWEMGISIPDIENLQKISKLFDVSIDYLMNEMIELEFNETIIEETTSPLKLIFMLIFASIILLASIAMKTANSSMSIILWLIIIGILASMFHGLKWAFLFLLNRRKKLQKIQEGGQTS